ncbi:hypothetical protein GGI16_000787 [Coemansia sp. S142-1]|nr:hypothetical protein GGI16_000787 [Coemansia sp. S142-1]
MTSKTAHFALGSSGDIETGKIQETLLQARLEDIRRDVRASKSTWAELRQQYPPGMSCFEPLNFSVSSWSAIANEDVTGLGDDLDADEAYSQAATMAAYGVDILSTALSGPTVNRELTEQANSLFVTLCATLMDTRDRHRSLINKAVAEKVDVFRRILDGLDSSPRTEATASYPESIKRKEQQSSPMTLQSEQRFSRPSTNDRTHSYSRGRSRSPDYQRRQPLRDHSTLQSSSATSLLDLSLSDIQSSSWYSNSLAPTQNHPPAGGDTRVSTGGAGSCPMANHPMSAVYRMGGRRTGAKLTRLAIIRTALMKYGLSDSEIEKYNSRYNSRISGRLERSWSRWVDWCEGQGVDPTKWSEDNLAKRLREIDRAGLPNIRLKPTVYSVWWAIEGDIHSKIPDH